MKGYSNPTPIKGNSVYKFYVYYPNPNGGKRLKKYFKTKNEAAIFSERGNIQTQSAGITIATLSEAHRRAYIDAMNLLKPYGIGVLDAIREYVEARKEIEPYRKQLPDIVKHFKKWNKVKEESTTLERAYGLYLDDMEAKRKSARRIADQKSRLGRFLYDMGGGRIVGLITPAMCNEWLNSLKVIEQKKVEGGQEANGNARKVKTRENISATTRNTYRAALSAFFAYCLMAGYVKANPIERVATSVSVSKETEFYKPDEILCMLSASDKLSDIRAYLAIGAFAGLRRAEIERLDYSCIDLEERTILLAAKNTKTKKRRAVNINDALAAWLAPYALIIRRGGKIIGANFRRRMDAFKAACGVKWIDNGLRHSFGTYFYALTSNEYEVAKQMGNEPEVMKEHYANQRVTRRQAEKYFNKCYEIDPKFYQVYVCHGISYSDAGNTDMALKKYEEAISINPQMPNAYILIANIYVEQSKLKEAVELYEKAAELKPDDAKTYTFIGNTYFMMDNLEKAILTYRKAINIDSNNQENKLVYLDMVQDYIKRKEEKVKTKK